MSLNQTTVSVDPREAFYYEQIRTAGSLYQGFDVLTSETVLGLAYTYDMYQQRCSKHLSDFGLSKSTLNILLILRHGPAEGMQLHGLGELLLVSRANVTGLIDNLQERGLVKRVVDEHDRRSRFAVITPEGQALVDQLMPVHIRAVRRMMQDLTDQEKRDLVQLLRKVRLSLAGNLPQLATGVAVHLLAEHE